MTKQELMESNTAQFKALYEEFAPNSYTDNSLYVEDDFANLFKYLPDDSFEGKVEIKRSFIGEFLLTGIENYCILNFASAKYPGGGVMHGSIAQEEDICRNTLLYFYLREFEQSHYAPGKFSGTDHLLDDFIIYSKGVATVHNLDGTLTLGAKNDYITSAAPDLRLAQPDTFSNRELQRTWIYRVMGVFGAAIKNGNKKLVLGPWGCGVFKNDVKFVAWCFASMLNHFGSEFEEIIFLAPDDLSYEAFSKQFNV